MPTNYENLPSHINKTKYKQIIKTQYKPKNIQTNIILLKNESYKHEK